RNVEEMVFVVVDDKALHLRRIQSAVSLCDVDGRDPKIGKDVTRHSLERQQASQYNSHDGHDERNWSAQSKRDNVHSIASYRGPRWTFSLTTMHFHTFACLTKCSM